MDAGQLLCHHIVSQCIDPSADPPNQKIHNQKATRALMAQIFDPQMSNLADIDCFSQVIFKNVEDYKRMKQDPWYKEHLVGDHEKFADTRKST